MPTTKTKRGFTLIELLVVIAIIGILSAIGLVSLHGAREKARDAQRINDLGQIRNALIMYFDDNEDKYPSSGAIDAAIDLNIAGNPIATILIPAYLSRMPQDPSYVATEYRYLYISNSTNAAGQPGNSTAPNFALVSNLEAKEGVNMYVMNKNSYAGTSLRNNNISCGASPGDIDVCGLS